MAATTIDRQLKRIETNIQRLLDTALRMQNGRIAIQRTDHGLVSLLPLGDGPKGPCTRPLDSLLLDADQARELGLALILESARAVAESERTK